MNNPNPFVPQGSLLEQQSKRRSHFKWGVLFVLTLGVVGLSAMLFQGCKREEENNPPEADNNPPPMQTNDVTQSETNPPANENPNMAAGQTPQSGAPQAPANAVPPIPPPQPPVVPAAPAPQTENEYVVVKGDTLGKIAKANGTTVKAIEEANPGVTPTRLQVGKKLIIPAGATTGANAAGETANGLAANGDEVYVVKPGDSLTKIAHHYGVTVKAIMTENNLTTTKINVGRKLEIPAKQAAEPAPVNSTPATTTAPESAPPPSNPPAQPAPGQQQ